MKRILTKCYNNSEWLSDTDFIILNLSDEKIKEIKTIQDKLNTNFSDSFAEVHLYMIDFEVYSANVDNRYLNNEIIEWLENSQDETILLKDNDFDYSSIPDSESENNIRLDTYMLKVYKNTIQCICYPKYDGSIEIFSEEINLEELW